MLRKERRASDHTVYTGAKIFIIDAVLLRIHVDKGISDHIFKERPDIDLTEDKSQRFSSGIAQHHKLVSGKGLEQMQLIGGGPIVQELLVSKYIGGERSMREIKDVASYLPDSFLIIFRRESTTPYTSLTSSSKDKPVLDIPTGDGGACSNGETVDWAFISLTATTTPEADVKVFLGLEYIVNVEELVSAAGATTACETAGRMPLSTAGFGRRVLCQSW